VAEEDAEPGRRCATMEGSGWSTRSTGPGVPGHRDEFTINIALIESAARCGRGASPRPGTAVAAEPGTAFLQEAGDRHPVATREFRPRSHRRLKPLPRDPEALAQFEAERRIKDSISIGSSLKVLLVATGEADLSQDSADHGMGTAARRRVLRAAGGLVTEMDGRPLRYGKPGWENPFFLAIGREPGIVAWCWPPLPPGCRRTNRGAAAGRLPPDEPPGCRRRRSRRSRSRRWTNAATADLAPPPPRRSRRHRSRSSRRRHPPEEEPPHRHGGTAEELWVLVVCGFGFGLGFGLA